MNVSFRLPVVALLSLLIVVPALAQNKKKKDAAPKTEPIKALIIAGGCCHDYTNQGAILAKGIGARANVVFDEVRQGGAGRDVQMNVYKTPRWAEGYDVVIHNECFGGVTDVDFVESLTKPHKKGVAAVVIHCSLHSYRGAETDEWRKFLGVKSMRHQQKDPVDVKNLKPDHPIMMGFPKSWRTPTAELYEILEIYPNTTPLGEAFGTRTDQNHVCIWTNTFGKGRVFGTSLGHYNEMMQEDVYLDFVTRGLLWSVDKLGKDGKPKPGYEAAKSD
jgi:type 1 glutamine amidotransferase